MAGIGKYSHGKLVSIIKAAHQVEDEDHGDAEPSGGSNRHLQFNNNGSFRWHITLYF